MSDGLNKTVATKAAEGRALMLYDGVCGLCNNSVRFVMKRDRRDRIRFAPQQSALAEALLGRHGIDREAMLGTNSVYLALDYDSPSERLLSRSDVPANLLLLLGGGWGVLARILLAVPKFIRDAAYNFVARHRYLVSKRYESCPLPLPAERAKFLA